jgi:hypothetical protein
VKINDVVIGVYCNDIIGNQEAQDLFQDMRNEATDLDKFMHDCQMVLEKFGISASLTYPNGKIKELTRNDKTFFGWEGIFAGTITTDQEIYDTEIYGPLMETKWMKDKYEICLAKGDSTSGGGGGEFSYSFGCYLELEQFPLMFEEFKYKLPLLENKDNEIKLNNEIDNLVNEFEKGKNSSYKSLLQNNKDFKKLTQAKRDLQTLLSQCESKLSKIENDTLVKSARVSSFNLEIPEGLNDPRISKLMKDMFPSKFFKTKGHKITKLYEEIGEFEDKYPELFLGDL